MSRENGASMSAVTMNAAKIAPGDIWLSRTRITAVLTTTTFTYSRKVREKALITARRLLARSARSSATSFSFCQRPMIRSDIPIASTASALRSELPIVAVATRPRFSASNSVRRLTISLR